MINDRRRNFIAMRYLIFVTILLVVNLAHADENSVLHFDQLGFQIQAIEEKNDSITSLPLTLRLPTTNGFSPNITVILQPYKGTLKNYKAVTDQQLNQAQLKIIKSEVKDDTYTFEYSGFITGANLHVYSKAQIKDNIVYLTTGTDLMIQWDLNKERLLRAVNSFKFKK